MQKTSIQWLWREILMPTGIILILAALSSILWGIIQPRSLSTASIIPGQKSQNDFSLDQFRDGMEKQRAIVIDARSKAAYTKEHICGALNLQGFDQQSPDFTEALSKLRSSQAPIYLYCSSSECQAAEQLREALVAAGIPKSRLTIFSPGWALLQYAMGIPKCSGNQP